MARNIMAEEGVGALYRGLSAGLLRQATYTTARLGIYNYLSEYLKEVNQGKARTVLCSCLPQQLAFNIYCLCGNYTWQTHPTCKPWLPTQRSVLPSTGQDGAQKALPCSMRLLPAAVRQLGMQAAVRRREPQHADLTSQYSMRAERGGLPRACS